MAGSQEAQPVRQAHAIEKDFDYPPDTCTYAELLHWHLFIHGTRSNGKRKLWEKPSKFADVIGCSNKSLGRYLGKASPPDQPYDGLISTALLGKPPHNQEWADDLENARIRSKQTGNLWVAPGKQKRVRRSLIEEASAIPASANDLQQQLEKEPEVKIQYVEVSYCPKPSPEAMQLADFMSDISRRTSNGGWADGNEYGLWGLVKNGPRGQFEELAVNTVYFEILKTLSDACGGWIVFNEDAPPEAPRYKWIPLDVWKTHLQLTPPPSDKSLGDILGDALKGIPTTLPKHPYPLDGKYFVPLQADGQRRPVYGFVDYRDRQSWKREALFFDKIVLPFFAWDFDPEPSEYATTPLWDMPIHSESIKAAVDLMKKGVFLPAVTHAWAEGNAEEAVEERLNQVAIESSEYDPLLAKLLSLKYSRTHGVDAYPLYESLQGFSTSTNESREAVLRVVFSRIPSPLESTSWDEILEYRRDPESQRRFSALRVWVNNTVSKQAPINEVIEELEYLVAEFEAHIRRHKLKYEMTPFESVVSLSSLGSEMAARSKMQELGKGFSIGMASSSLFPDSEFTAPGKELAYICATNARFSE